MTDAATVTRHLSQIQRLAEDLPEQAEHAANSRRIMGGDALANLAPVANLERWAWQQDAAEDAALRGARSWPTLEHEDDDDTPVLQSLVLWSEDRRRVEGHELDGRTPTIATEAAFLRYYADAMWRDEPHWEEYAEEVSKALRKLENILAAGKRDEATRVRCVADHCETKPTLKRIVTDDGLQEWWKCRACRTKYDRTDFAAAYNRQANGGDRYVTKRDAALVLVDQGTPDRLVQAWLDGEGLTLAEAYCDVESQQEMVRWSPLYRLHRAERQAVLVEQKRRARAWAVKCPTCEQPAGAGCLTGKPDDKRRKPSGLHRTRLVAGDERRAERRGA